MRNGEVPIDTNDFFREEVEFKKKGDDLVVVKKQNNGEKKNNQDTQETEPTYLDRLKKTRKDFEEEVKPKKPKKQDGVFVDMDDEVIDAEKDAETVVSAEVVQAEAIKTDMAKEQKAVQEKPEVVFGIENKINELKKKKADMEEITANYEKALSESTEERIMQRIISRIQDEKVKIDKIDAEIKKEDIKENGVNLAEFNNLRDRIAEFEERGQNIRDNKDSKGKDLSEEDRKKLVDLQDEQHEEYLKNKQELDEIYKAAKEEEVK